MRLISLAPALLALLFSACEAADSQNPSDSDAKDQGDAQDPSSKKDDSDKTPEATPKDSPDPEQDPEPDPSNENNSPEDKTPKDEQDPDDKKDKPSCEPPDPAQPWITAYQRELVAKLSGEQELDDGTRLGVRQSVSERAATRAFLVDFWSESFEVQVHDYRTNAANILVKVPATHPPEGGKAPTLVLGAHFDTVAKSPGANDNATGVAAVMSAARFAASMPCRSRDWHFVLFDEEEIGLVGSAAYAKLLKQDKVDVQEVHTIDQMGWDKDGDLAIELERPDEGLLECYEKAQDSTRQSFDLVRTRTGSTDHVSFRKAGFAAIGITEEYKSGDTTPHYHRPGDTFETVNFDYLESTTILMHQMVIDRSEVP